MGADLQNLIAPTILTQQVVTHRIEKDRAVVRDCVGADLRVFHYIANLTDTLNGLHDRFPERV